MNSSSEPRSRGIHARTARVLSEALLRIVDSGIASLLWVAPLFMGGRHPLGKLVYVSLVCATVLAWCARQCLIEDPKWKRTNADWLILSALSLVVLQLLPLPLTLLLRLSPALAELLPLWTTNHGETLGLGNWRYVSLYPNATRIALVVFLAHVMLFLLLVQRIQGMRDIQRLIRWVALGTTLMAMLGLTQYLLGNGNFLWVYADPERKTFDAVKGPFFNQNHFAHFLALGISPLIWCIQSGAESAHRVRCRRNKSTKPSIVFGRPSKKWPPGSRRLFPLCFAIGLVIFAGALSFSRGGLAVFALSIATYFMICGKASWINLRFAVSGGAISLVLILALMIHGYAFLAHEWTELWNASSVTEVLKGRLTLWRSLLTAIHQFPIFGTGVGTHSEVYPIFFGQSSYLEFEYGENGYLQVFLECGVFGFAILISGICLSLRWCFRTLASTSDARIRAATGVCLAGIVTSAFHALVDFAWYIPACMSLTIVFLACACHLHTLAQTHDGVPEGGGRCGGKGALRLLWCGVAVVVLVGTTQMTQVCLPSARASIHWDQYRKTVLSKTSEINSGAMVLDMANQLNDTLRCNPYDAKANLRMANLLIHTFESRQLASQLPMSLDNIRDAALASKFSSNKERDKWLDAVLGRNKAILDRALHYTRFALLRCPLQGQAYMYLGRLSFLDGGGSDVAESCINQALILRPHHGAVLIAAAKQAARSGQTQKALTYFSEALAQHRYKPAVIAEFSKHVSAQLFLEHFELDLDAMAKLYTHYRITGQNLEAKLVAARYVKALSQAAAAKRGADAAELWRRAFDAATFLGDIELSLDCIHQAVHCRPDSFQLRRDYALQLARNENFADATKELKWCLRRRPDDTIVREQLVFSLKKSLVSRVRE